MSLVDEAGEATPVACDVAERRPGVWMLEALIPPQVYPVTYVSAQLRLHGHHLGRMELAFPIVTRTHEPMDLTLAFPVTPERLSAAGLDSNGRRSEV